MHLHSWLIASLVSALQAAGGADDLSGWKAEVPRVWDDAAIADIEVPLPQAEFSPRHVSSDYYYSIPVRPVFKSYPVYHPDYEPEGYWEWLHEQDPEIAFDPSKLVTKADWIAAGELVFHEGNEYSTGSELSAARDRTAYEVAGMPITPEGLFPYSRYFIREKGKVELGTNACAACHTRVMPDGSVVSGAQGNFPLGAIVAYEIRKELREHPELAHVRIGEDDSDYRDFIAPWVEDDINESVVGMGLEQLADIWGSFPVGVMPRHRSSYFHPTKVASLIGIRDRQYLDASGLVQLRDLTDLMRYAALNQGGDELSLFGDRRVGIGSTELPDPETLTRYSDEQLYALALFIDSLEPPANPHPVDDAARRGEQVFEREKCQRCHPAPLYTNNKLSPADGFEPPQDHFERFHVTRRRVSTDPNLTMKTRRGTGYYKVPSLRGAWFRSAFFHSGSLATLEDVLDPRRLEPDSVPTNYRGVDGRGGPVLGHEFGLELDDEERADLIAFLKTLD